MIIEGDCLELGISEQEIKVKSLDQNIVSALRDTNRFELEDEISGFMSQRTIGELFEYLETYYQKG